MQPNSNINKIIFVVGQLGNGGLEKQLYYLIKYLKQNDFQVQCVVWNVEKDNFYLPIFTELLNDDLICLKEKSSFKKIFELRTIAAKFSPKLVISFTSFINFPVFCSSVFRKFKAIGSLRTSAKIYIKNNGIKAYLNLLFPKRILVNSKNAINELNAIKIIKSRNVISLIENVIDIDHIQKAPINQEYSNYSISVGNIRKAKRLDRMIDVFLEIKKENTHFLHLHVGGGKDFDLIQERIKKENLESNIILLGQRSDVYSLLQSANIFLHFSEFEGSPNVVMEAMASGLPVVTTECGDAKEFISNEENGFVINPFSIEEFCLRYKEINTNQDLRDLMVKNNLKKIQKNDISNISNIFFESLKNLNLY